MSRRRYDSVTVKGRRPAVVTTGRPSVDQMVRGLARFGLIDAPRCARIIVLRGHQGSGKTLIARALAMEATARGESAIVLDAADNLRGLAAIAKRVDLVLICHLYPATLPKLPKGMRPQFVLTCEVGR